MMMVLRMMSDDDFNYNGDDDDYVRMTMIMTTIIMMIELKTTILMKISNMFPPSAHWHPVTEDLWEKLLLLGQYACRISGECCVNHHQGGEALTSLPLTSIGQLHDDVILLKLPESFILLFPYAN